MILLERTAPPEVLFSRQVGAIYREAEAFFAQTNRAARRRRFDFDDEILGHSDVLTELRRTSNGCCSFCSRPERPGVAMGAHRLRPAQEAVAADGRIGRAHYWWLAYEWENLYLACDDCRTAQGAKFPTQKRRARVGIRERLGDREQPYLIEPAEENPESHFAYLDSGEMVWRSERGLVTIETFDLNRPLLVAERRGRIERTRSEIREAAAMITENRPGEFATAFLRLYSREAPFAALRRQLFNQWVQFRPRKVGVILTEVGEGEIDLDEVVGDLERITNRAKANLSRMLGPPEMARALDLAPAPRESDSDRQVLREAVPKQMLEPEIYRDSREIHSVKIRNFQGIDQMELRITGGAGEGSWLMLLGENGVGKTAALKAIVLTLMEADERQRILADLPQVVRQGQKEGWVEVRLTGTRQIRRLSFRSDSEALHSRGSAAPALLAAYGATRLLPRTEEYADFGQGPHTASLFDPRAPLSRPSEWIPGLSGSEFDAVARGLARVLRLREGEEVRRDKERGIRFDSPRGRFGLEQLSEGYRTMAVLTLDMMRLFLRRWGDLEAAEGIVLIDEIGAHLHPRWQMRVVSTLRQTFPRIQFVATTHDPLCLRGLHDGEVVVLRWIDGQLIIEQEGLPSLSGLTVDQLLTSEHFGLYSALDPELEAEFERYYELLAKGRPSQAEGPELYRLRERLAGKRQLGRTRRERLALEAVDENLAQEQRARSAGDLRKLPEAARRGAREVLASAREA